MMKEMDFLTPFSPGETVPKHGSYWVRHLAHRAPYVAVVSTAERLPHCSQCKVVFEYASDLTHGAISLRNDGDLYPPKKAWPL